MLDGVFDILQWNGRHADDLDLADSAYTSLLAEELGATLGQLDATQTDLAARTLRLLHALDVSSLRRVLLAPETSSRLLWDHPGRCDERDLWQYLGDVLEVEAAQLVPPATRTEASDSPRPRWSALGDVCVSNDGVVLQTPLDGLVIDADSPAAVCFDSSTLFEGSLHLRHYRDPNARIAAMQKVDCAMRNIDRVTPDVADFVRRFTLVANIVQDRDGAQFSSGSTGEYIGRSMFINAHLPMVDSEVIADALVHEAVHALLYMHEVRQPWVPGEALLPADVAILSPWTGARLRLRNFLQACFVWFALSHFWSRAGGARSPFRASRVEDHLALARKGFLKGTLLTRLGDCAPHVAPQLLELVQSMQDDVVSSSQWQ